MVLEISHNLFINAHKVKKLLKAFIGNSCSNKNQNYSNVAKNVLCNKNDFEFKKI